MTKEFRRTVYDRALRLEAYRFKEMARPFPNHFHAYYVIGLMEEGERALSCAGREYAVKKGDVLLFNPGDCHACVQRGGALDYRGLNIAGEVMLDLAEEVTGRREPPVFFPSVYSDEEASACLRRLHERVMLGSREPGLEKDLRRLIALLLQACGESHPPKHAPASGVERACAFMEEHFRSRLCLDQICRQAGLSKSTLLRVFAREKGVTPHAYLENLRVGEARRLLEQGVPPAETALRTGFSDQSHFSNRFNRLIGLSPGAYRESFRDGAKRTLPPEEESC